MAGGPVILGHQPRRLGPGALGPLFFAALPPQRPGPSLYSDAVLAAGPSLYWRLNDPSGTIAHDSSGNARDGTYVGGPALSRTGGLLNDPDAAVLLDGSTQYISSSYAPFAANSQRTFEFLAFRNTSSSLDVLIAGDQAATQPFLRLGASSNTLAFAPVAGTTVSWAAAWPGASVWVHCVLTYDDSTKVAELFIDGVSLGQVTAAAGYDASPGNFKAGARATNTDPLDAYLDEIAVYTRILTSAEIKNHATIALCMVPLDPSTATATTSLALTAAATIVCNASTAATTTTLALTASTAIPCNTSAAASTTTLALTASTAIPFAASTASAATSLALSALTKIALDTPAAAATTALALTAPTTIPFSASAGAATTTLALSALTYLPLDTPSAAATTALALTAQTTIPLNASTATAATALALSATTQVPLDASTGAAATSLALNAPTQVPFNGSSGAATTALALNAPTEIVLAASTGVASTTLTVLTTAEMPLATSTASATTALALSATTQIPFDGSTATASTSLTLTAPALLSLDTPAGAATTALALTILARLILDTPSAAATTALALSAPTTILLDSSAGAATTALAVGVPIATAVGSVQLSPLSPPAAGTQTLQVRARAASGSGFLQVVLYDSDGTTVRGGPADFALTNSFQTFTLNPAGITDYSALVVTFQGYSTDPSLTVEISWIELKVPLTSAAHIPDLNSNGEATTALTLTAPTTVALDASTGAATTTLALATPAQLPLDASVASSTTALTVLTDARVPLSPSTATATTILAISATTQIPLDTSGAVGDTSLALTANAQVTLNPATASTSTTLTLTAAARLSLSASAVTSTAISVTTPLEVVLAPASAVATATLALPRLFIDLTSNATALTSLELHVPVSVTESVITLAIKTGVEVAHATRDEVHPQAVQIERRQVVASGGIRAVKVTRISDNRTLQVPRIKMSALGIGPTDIRLSGPITAVNKSLPSDRCRLATIAKPQKAGVSVG